MFSMIKIHIKKHSIAKMYGLNLQAEKFNNIVPFLMAEIEKY